MAWLFDDYLALDLCYQISPPAGSPPSIRLILLPRRAPANSEENMYLSKLSLGRKASLRYDVYLYCDENMEVCITKLTFVSARYRVFGLGLGASGSG